MAVGSPLPQSSSRPSDSGGFGGQIVKYDRYIENQLYRTRRQVKGVDIAGSLLLLAVASLAYLMLVALIDHWGVSGGLRFAGRLVAFGLLAAGVLAFTVLRLVPLMLRRVNPVYAAYTIERHRPGIKNGLINFLLLRSGSERLPERVYEAMEVQAVNALSATNTDVAVDRAPVIRLLLAMVAILVCMAFYAVLSPKNPFTSFRRIMSPWANVSAPTRVAIEDIQPGDGSGFHDQHVMVSAVVRGLRSAEEVTLRYSTRDGQVVDKPLHMALAENGYRHAVELPPDNLGLQQDLEYRIEAGDAISPSYKIRVDTAPTIVLEEIEYKYPAYSELPPRKVARHGDIQALDGTRVTLRAKANQPIGQAHLDFECDGRNDLEMHIKGTRAEISFALEWNEKNRRPEHTSYQLRFRNDEGHENPKPIRYAIDVIPDLAPEVEFVEPHLDPTKDLVVPPRKPVRFVLEAADADFKLASVTFHARRRGSPLINSSLLAAPRSGTLHRDYLLDLKPLELKPGEEVEFWASADDNRQPKANHAETPHYQLRIATPDDKDQRPDDKAANPDEQQGEKGGDSDKKQRGKRNEDNQQGNQGEAGEQQKRDGKPQPGKQNDQQGQQGKQSDDEKSAGGKNQHGDGGKKSSSGESSGSNSGEGDSNSAEDAKGAGQKRSGQPKQGGEQGEGEKSEQSNRINPERDAGKAIEEINKHFNQKEKENQPQQESQPGKDDQPSGEQAGRKSQQQGSQEKNQERDSQESDTGNQPDQNAGGGASGKQSATQQGGSSGGQQQTGSEKQPSGKQPDGKDAGKPTDAKQSRQSDGSQNDKAAQPQTKSGNKGEPNPPAEKKNEKQQSQGERSAGAEQADDSQGDKPQGEKQTGKSGKQPSSGEKGAEGAEKGTPNEGGDQTMKDASGGSKQGDAKKSDEGAKHADQETRPRDGQGGQARGAGETDDKMKKHEGESPDQKGGDPDSRDKGSGGAGNSEGANKHGAPTTHGGNQGREKKQLTPDNKKGTSEDEPESSSEDKRQSDSQGAEQGEHDGGGKSGGGQRSNNEGTGTAGQNSEADQGGQQGETQGEGPTGKKGGRQQKADKPTGGESSGEKGPGTNQGKGQDSDRGIKADSPETADPRGHTNESRQPTQPQSSDRQPQTEKQPGGKKKPREKGAPQSNAKQQAEGEPTPSDRGGNDLRGGRQRSNPTSGGQPGPDDQTTAPPPEADESEPGGEDANLEYARKATDLALERLKDQLAKGNPDPDLLEKLNWTPEDIKRFVEQWERLKNRTDEAGLKGNEARQEFDDALRSLGLRPRGASLSTGKKRDDRQHNLHQDRRIAPPPEYQEQWYEYKKSVNKTSKNRTD